MRYYSEESIRNFLINEIVDLGSSKKSPTAPKDQLLCVVNGKWEDALDFIPNIEINETKKILILDKDDDYKPNFIIEIPKGVRKSKVQGVIDRMEGSLPGEYTWEDLSEVLCKAFGVTPERFEEVVW